MTKGLREFFEKLLNRSNDKKNEPNWVDDNTGGFKDSQEQQNFNIFFKNYKIDLENDLTQNQWQQQYQQNMIGGDNNDDHKMDEEQFKSSSRNMQNNLNRFSDNNDSHKLQGHHNTNLINYRFQANNFSQFYNNNFGYSKYYQLKF